MNTEYPCAKRFTRYRWALERNVSYVVMFTAPNTGIIIDIDKDFNTPVDLVNPNYYRCWGMFKDCWTEKEFKPVKEK